MVQSGSPTQRSRSTSSQSRRDSQALSLGSQRSGATPETGLSYDKPPPGAFTEGIMASTATVNMVNTNWTGEGICFYCHNQEPSFPPHKFQNQCPWYKFHLTQGTIHLNRVNRLCLRPERDGAPENFLTRDAPHGVQVCMRTAGTEFDENIKDRPKEQTVSGPPTAVQGLIFISEESDSSEEDELEGFEVVKEREITEANASRIKSPLLDWPDRTVGPRTGPDRGAVQSHFLGPDCNVSLRH
jgi:hypothetical protein